MKGKSLFITGTDTDVGKTFITALLGGILVEAGYKVGMRKPIASGALQDEETGNLYSVDAKEHIRLANLSGIETTLVNQVCLPGEFSPKIAAQLSHTTINSSDILNKIKERIIHYDYTLIEGAGGITTPIKDTYTFMNFAKDLGSKMLIVADGRLGSINRAVLTASYAQQHNIEVIGFIIDDQDETDELLLTTNIKEIELYTQLPVLGVVPKFKSVRNREEEIAWGKEYLMAEEIVKLI